MKVGTILHGFAVQRVRELDELQAKLWEMEHIKSGAQLCWLERADEKLDRIADAIRSGGR